MSRRAAGLRLPELTPPMKEVTEGAEERPQVVERHANVRLRERNV